MTEPAFDLLNQDGTLGFLEFGYAPVLPLFKLDSKCC